MSDDTTSTAPQATAKKKPLALGRGLGALLGETRREEPLVNPAALSTASGAAAAKDGLALLAVASIVPSWARAWQTSSCVPCRSANRSVVMPLSTEGNRMFKSSIGVFQFSAVQPLSGKIGSTSR